MSGSNEISNEDFSEKSSDESYDSHDEQSSSSSERSYKENVAGGCFFLLEDSDVCKALLSDFF